jgi:hypothetical protein
MSSSPLTTAPSTFRVRAGRAALERVEEARPSDQLWRSEHGCRIDRQMETGIQKAWRIVVAIAVAAGLLLFGFVVLSAGRDTLREWAAIRPALLTCGLLWVLAGAVMIVTGLWVLGSLGRHRIPLLAGGAATALAGMVLVVGVLTYVIPCSGPS